MIEVNCPQCGQHYSLADSLAGKQARCAKCNAIVQVPGLAVPAAAPVASPAEAPQGGWDPRAQPLAPAFGAAAASERPKASMRMTAALRSTRPWVIFLAILGFIGCGFMVLGGLMMMVIMGVAGGKEAGAIGGIIGVVYLAFGALYFVPAFLLMKFGSSIGKFLQTGSTDHADTALEAQKSFWKFIGIMTIIAMALGILFAIIGAVLGAKAASKFENYNHMQQKQYGSPRW
jgi:hypothetical protein